MRNSTGYKIYGVLFLSYLLEKSLFFQKYKHQRQNFIFMSGLTRVPGYPKTTVTVIPHFWVHHHTSCALDNVNIRLLLFLLLYFGSTTNQMAIPYHGSLQPPQKHWVHEERLKINIHSWKFIGWGSSGRIYKKHTSREKKPFLKFPLAIVLSESSRGMNMLDGWSFQSGFDSPVGYWRWKNSSQNLFAWT